MKNVYRIALAIGLVAAPVVAFGGISFRNLSSETAARRHCVTLRAPSTVGAAVGAGGVIAQINYTGTTVDVTQNYGAPNTQIRTPPYASRLRMGLADGGDNDTLTCTNLTVQGYDQFGRPAREIVATVTETASTVTTRAFSAVTRLSGTCVDGTDATDFLMVSTSLEIGLPARLRQLSDIETACIEDATDSDATKCAGHNINTTGDLESALDLYVDVLDASAAMFGTASGLVAGAAGDRLCVSVRPSWNFD
jgi:hypothetical protein